MSVPVVEPTGTELGALPVEPHHRARRATGRLLVRRVAGGVVLVVAASLLVFIATQALPGDAARAILGRDAPPARVAALREQLGLDRPLVAQYVGWLGDLVTGNLGDSLVSGRSVASELAPRVRNTATLLVLTLVVAIPMSLALGVWLAVRRGRARERAASTVLLSLASLPEFVVGIGLIVLLATDVVTWFPAVSLLPRGVAPWEEPDVLVLPVLSLTVLVVPYLSRMVRAAVAEALDSDYVEMARLKGLSERDVVWRHAMPNALPPIAQISAFICAYLAGGSVIIESLFNYPGIGSALIEAVRLQDLPVVQVLVIGIGAFYVVVGIAADLLANAVTPRAREAGR